MEVNKISAETREKRLEFLREIQAFEDDIKQKIDGILDQLGWDRETIKKNAEKKAKQRKPKKEEPVQFSENYQDFYAGRIPSLTIDEELQGKIIEDAKKANPGMSLKLPEGDLKSRNLPKSPEDVLFNFTREERLALYEYSAEKLKHPPEDEKSYLLKLPDESSSKSMTFADVVDMERQMKRRRMKYRTTKEPPLSYSETIRKLINTQTEAWESYLKQNEDPPAERHHKRKREKRHKKEKHKRRRSRS
ncbi:uncharacterized protein LOC129809864 [Phlebotomus papatasi]|uniref:uncharacterized protein LOC129809864 n=1 Tax=Phlebotomus papatasi TaxID=29031 RepID=UPI0024839A90|nr:uncharacterized protein LOC129809864 [Phlebotomus papatasi]